MFCRTSWSHASSVAAVFLILLGLGVLPMWAQHGSTGTVTVTVVDPSGSVVQGAQLELRDLATNSARKSETQDMGTYRFVNLELGTYKLTVSKTGFKTAIFDSVVVQATKTTDISATLAVGAVSEVVVVTESGAPLVETSSSAISTVVDLKQIENLPIQGRDLAQLTRLVPGYTGTWDGLPSIAQGNNIDGVIGSASRMKFSGNSAPAVSPRLEDIQEMTVQTNQLDLNQGYGQANMQTNFVTRRGGSTFHGRVFEDHRNAALNANSWHNDAVNFLNPDSPPIRKNPFILNDFGGSIGGPIIKDKLFFFGSFAMSKQPGSSDASVWVLTPAAQQGNFTYTDSNNNQQTVNVLQLAGNSGFPSSVIAQTANTLSAVNNALQYGSLTATGDPNLQQLNWQVAAPTTIYYPTVRVDYNLSEKMRFNVAFNETKTSQPGANIPNLPGPDFAKTGAGNQFKSYTTALGFDWTVSPTLVNEFRGGFLYNYNGFAFNAQPLEVNNPQISWNLPNLPYTFNTAMNGTNFQVPTGSYYPLFNASDTVTWQHAAHTMNFGVSWWREQDHYYNGVQGFPVIDLGSNTAGQSGLATGDPALAAFNGALPNSNASQQQEAQTLYAILTGRVNRVTGQYAYSPKTGDYAHALGAYNLDELQKAWGLFFQDSYRVRPNLTLNYGLRWDFTGADHDLTNFYHSSSPADIFGPSGVWNLFNPGSLKGTMDPLIFQNSHPYNDWNVSPQPAIGIAWNPQAGSGILGKIMGGDKTVIRTGFSLRKFTEPQQYVWNQASDYGSFYYQSFFANANNISQPGNFTPGSLFLDNPTPSNGYGYAPASYLKSQSAADFYLGGPGVNGIDPHLQQPYTMSWNLGIQRRLGESRALELRYVGNRTLHQWNTINTNEVNIFENGFLQEFKNAQANLAINAANGYDGVSNPRSFANLGFAGEQALPIFTAAFAGEASGPGGLDDFTDRGSFMGYMTSGQAGAAAGLLAGTGGPNYFCNLVGASFGPCANAGYTGPGAGYPINFFTANPFVNGTNQTGYLVAQAYSTYNALQVDFRQRAWHGLQFDANYTWSKTLGTGTQNNWQGATATFTLRDPHLSYGPALFDIRHTVNINGTYDLPFGRGKQFLNQRGVVDKVVGGWTIGGIATFRGGLPFLLQGGNATFNDYGDGGVVLNGVTASQLQSAIGVYRQAGTAQVAFINPKYLNGQYITPNTTPGVIGQRIWLYGPHYFNQDMSITKSTPIRENIRFTFQAMFLNAFNHPNFGPGPANGCLYYCFTGGFSPGVQNGGSFLTGSTYGSGSVTSTTSVYKPRQIELRANIEF